MELRIHYKPYRCALDASYGGGVWASDASCRCSPPGDVILCAMQFYDARLLLEYMYDVWTTMRTDECVKCVMRFTCPGVDVKMTRLPSRSLTICHP
jgi:hypothetical protein